MTGRTRERRPAGDRTASNETSCRYDLEPIVRLMASTDARLTAALAAAVAYLAADAVLITLAVVQ